MGGMRCMGRLKGGSSTVLVFMPILSVIKTTSIAPSRSTMSASAPSSSHAAAVVPCSSVCAVRIVSLRRTTRFRVPAFLWRFSASHHFMKIGRSSKRCISLVIGVRVPHIVVVTNHAARIIIIRITGRIWITMSMLSKCPSRRLGKPFVSTSPSSLLELELSLVLRFLLIVTKLNLILPHLLVMNVARIAAFDALQSLSKHE